MGEENYLACSVPSFWQQNQTKDKTNPFNIFYAFDDVAPLDCFFHCIRVTKDCQVFIQGLLNEATGQRGEMSQFPEYL